MLEIANPRSILTVFGKFEPLNVVGHSVNPQKAHPCVILCVLSHCALKSTHRSLQ